MNFDESALIFICIANDNHCKQTTALAVFIRAGDERFICSPWQPGLLSRGEHL